MRQVLFHIPLKPFSWLPSWWPDWNLPIYGFGMMLFIVFLTTNWWASRRAKKEGINPQYIQDLAIWIFVVGLIGARIVFMLQYHLALTEFFVIWQGGLVFYGSFIGGVVGYLLGYFFIIRKHGISTWKLADIIAPCAAIGLFFGRMGCLLNGCCFGNVACDHTPGITFPLSAPSRYALVERGLQTPAGFLLERGTLHVSVVEPGSQAEAAGLRAGDDIIAANGQPTRSPADLKLDSPERWPRGKNDLDLEVQRHGTDAKQIEQLHFLLEPRTLPLIPTQIYESISMALLFLVMTAYYPLRRRDGMVMLIFIFGYSVHRFLNEMLRKDTDPVVFVHTPYALTISQVGSLLLFAVGLVLLVWRLRSPPTVTAPLKASP